MGANVACWKSWEQDGCYCRRRWLWSNTGKLESPVVCSLVKARRPRATRTKSSYEDGTGCSEGTSGSWILIDMYHEQGWAQQLGMGCGKVLKIICTSG